MKFNDGKVGEHTIMIPKTLDSLNLPIKYGLQDTDMGPQTNEPICSFCKSKNYNCPGHFGKIDLHTMLLNPLLFSYLFIIYDASCSNCYKFKISDYERNIHKELRKEDLFSVLKEVTTEKCPFCRDRKKIKKLNLKIIVNEKYIQPSKVFLHFHLLAENDGEIFKMLNIDYRSFFIHRVFLMPNRFRPLNVFENQIFESAHNIHLTRIIKVNNLLKQEIEDCLKQTIKKEYSDNSLRNTENICDKTVAFNSDALKAETPEKGSSYMNSVDKNSHNRGLSKQGVKKETSTAKNGIKEYFDLQNSFFSEENGVNDKIDKNLNTLLDTVQNKSLSKLNGIIATLQSVVQHYFDSTEFPSKIQPPGIKQILEKKDGLFRQNMMGKRVNYTARTVISPDPYIAADEIGVPEKIAKKLTFPERVTPFNRKRLEKAVINGSKYPGAEFVYEKGVKRLLSFVKNRKTVARTLLKNNAIVHRHMTSDDYVLVNRQPTLHKPGIMSHRVKILDGKTIRLHYVNCGSYNADFDGDEMNIHLCQSYGAMAEHSLSATHENFALSGKPLRGLVQDYVVAIFQITLKNSFFTRQEILSLLFSSRRKNFTVTRPAILRPRNIYTGKQLIQFLLETFGTVNYQRKTKIPPSYWNMNQEKYDFNTNKLICTNEPSTKSTENLEEEANCSIKEGKGKKASVLDKSASKNKQKPLNRDETQNANFYEKAEVIINHNRSNFNEKESVVNIQSGRFIHGVLDKSQIGPTTDSLIHHYGRIFNYKMTNELITALCLVISQYLIGWGVSLGISDLLLTEDADEKRSNILKTGISLGNQVTREILNLTIGSTSNSKEISLDKNERTNLNNLVKKEMHKTTSAVSEILIRNVQVPFPHNNMANIILSGAKGSIVNFSQISGLLGQQSLEGGRVPTLPNGQGLCTFLDYGVISNGFVINRFITGLLPSSFFFHCQGGREGLIDTAVKTSSAGYLQRSIVSILENAKVDYDGSVKDDGILQFLYGEDGKDPNYCKDANPNRNRIHPGESVGVIAAQAVGEPSTQMTLNTFHLAGCATNVTLGMPRLKEILMISGKCASKLLRGKFKNNLYSKDEHTRIKYRDHLQIGISDIPQNDQTQRSHLTAQIFPQREPDISKERKLNSQRQILPVSVDTDHFKVDTYEFLSDSDGKSRIDKDTLLNFLKGFISLPLADVLFYHRVIQSDSLEIIFVLNRDIPDKIKSNFKQKLIKILNKDTGISNVIYELRSEMTRLTLKQVENSDSSEISEPNGMLSCDKNNRKTQSPLPEYETLDEMYDDFKSEEKGDCLTYIGALSQHSDEFLKNQIANQIFDAKNVIKIRLNLCVSIDQAIEKMRKKFFIVDSGVENIDMDGDLVHIGGIEYHHMFDPIIERGLLPFETFTELQQRNHFAIPHMADLSAILDFNTIYSSDIYNTLEALGIEAARSSIISEIQSVFSSYGIDIDVRHLMLIADKMTYSGSYNAFNRHKMEGGLLSRMAFENTYGVLKKAFLFQQEDNLSDPTARIVLGLPIKNGTGFFEIIDEETATVLT